MSPVTPSTQWKSTPWGSTQEEAGPQVTMGASQVLVCQTPGALDCSSAAGGPEGSSGVPQEPDHPAGGQCRNRVDKVLEFPADAVTNHSRLGGRNQKRPWVWTP